MPNQSSCCNITNTSLLAVAQTAIGCGIGLLIAGRLGRSTQRTISTAVLVAGAAATAPVIYDIISRRVNHPHTERGLRRSLQSIRDDGGMSEDAEVF